MANPSVANKPAKVSYHSGRSKDTAKHNDRSMYSYGFEHRDENLHWDMFGIGFANSKSPSVDAENRFFEMQFSEILREQNERYIAQGHAERCKDISAFRESHMPHESIIQLGGVESRDNCDWQTSEAFARKVAESIVERYERCGLSVISWDIHCDERDRPNEEPDGTPHLHIRWTGIDEKGMPNVSGCLAEHGIERPDPNAKRSQKNNELVTFTAMQRDWLEDLGESMVDSFSRERDPDARHLKNHQFQSQKRREEQERSLAERQAELDELERLVATREAEAETIVATAKQKADEEAKRIKADADSDAQAVRAQANADAKSIREKAASALKEREDAVADRESSVAAKEKEQNKRQQEFQSWEDKLSAKQDAIDADKETLATELEEAQEAKRQFTEATKRVEAAEPTIDDIPLREAVPAIIKVIAEHLIDAGEKLEAANREMSARFKELGGLLTSHFEGENRSGTPIIDVVIEKLTSKKKGVRMGFDDLPQVKEYVDDMEFGG